MPAVTGKAYGENRTATTQPFQKIAMNWNGLLSFPRLHLGLGNVLGVRTSLERQIRPYAAAEGTPAAETRLVNAVLDGRIVQLIMAETTQTTMTAFLGWPFETWETQPEKGRTPSLATAKTSLDAARTAIAVLNQRATMQTMFMTTCPPWPRTTA